MILYELFWDSQQIFPKLPFTKFSVTHIEIEWMEMHSYKTWLKSIWQNACNIRFQNTLYFFKIGRTESIIVRQSFSYLSYYTSCYTTINLVLHV